MTDWDRRFLVLAQHVANWSKDPSTQTGAVIVRPDRTVASLGFNGFPRRTDDSPELYANRPEKYARVVHCEMNAILSAKESLLGYTLYTTGPCCDRCAAHVIQAGIARSVYGIQLTMREDWKESLERAQQLFTEAGVELVAL